MKRVLVVLLLMSMSVVVWATDNNKTVTRVIRLMPRLLLKKISGDTQVCKPEESAEKELKVKMVYPGGSDLKVEGVEIIFEIMEKPEGAMGQGIDLVNNSKTNSDGISSCIFTTGNKVGSYSVKAYADKEKYPEFRDFDGVTFTITALKELELMVKDNIDDCMEKGDLAFSLKGVEPESIDIENYSIELHHKNIMDMNNVPNNWIITDWSWDNIDDKTIKAEDVPQELTDQDIHSFAKRVKGVLKKEDEIVSETWDYDIMVKELWINDIVYTYNDANSGQVTKSWKAVVGEEFDYIANATDRCTEWKWELPEGGFFSYQWSLEPTGNFGKVGSMKITTSSMPDKSEWDSFGDKFGHLKVTCVDGNNDHIATSEHLSKKLKVYFNPNESNNPHGEKNWFYYWEAALLGDVSNLSYSPKFGHAGGSTDITYPFAITISDDGNPSFREPYSHADVMIEEGFTPYSRKVDGWKGIDFYISLVTHELQHRSDRHYYERTPDTDVDPIITTANPDINNLIAAPDRLPDAHDPFHLYINGANDTYPGTFIEYIGKKRWHGDWEYKARLKEVVTAPAEKDWSKGGKQW